MRKSDMLLNVIGEIKDKFIEESEIKRNTVPWIQIVAIATCICLVISAVTIPLHIKKESVGNPMSESENIIQDNFDENSSNSISENFADESEDYESVQDSSSSKNPTDAAGGSTPNQASTNQSVFICEIVSVDSLENAKEYNVKISEVLYSKADLSDDVKIYDIIRTYKFEIGKTYLISINKDFEITKSFTSAVENEKIIPVYNEAENILHGIDTVNELKNSDVLKSLN